MRSWICVRFVGHSQRNAGFPFAEEVSHERHVQETRRETPHANGTGRRDHCRTGIASGAKLDRLGRYASTERQHSRGVRKSTAGHADYTGQPGASLGGSAKLRDRKFCSLLEKFKPQQFVAARPHPGQGMLVPYCRFCCPCTGSGRKQKSARSTCRGSAAQYTRLARCCSSFRRQKNHNVANRCTNPSS